MRRTLPPDPIAIRSTVIAALIALGSLEVTLAVGTHAFFDLHVYQGAVRSWVHGGSLYGYLLPPQSRYGFTYPPFAALLLFPLAQLPTRLAGWITVVATVAATAAIAVRLTAGVSVPARMRRYPITGIVVLAALGLCATRVTLAEGQINMYVLLLVVLDLGSARPSPWSGVGVGIAAAIKLTPAVFVAYLFVAGRRRAAGVAAATFGVCGLIGVAVAPRASIEFWTGALWQFDRVGAAGAATNESVRGVLARAGVGSLPVVWLIAVGVLAVVWWLRVRRAARLNDGLGGFAVTAVFGSLISPITWIHHQVFLIPALIVAASRAGTSRTHPNVTRARHRRRPRYGAAVSIGGRLICGVLVYTVLVIPVDGLARPMHGLAAFAVGNAHVWIALGLFLLLPLRSSQRSTLATLGPMDAATGPDRMRENSGGERVGGPVTGSGG